LKQQGAALRADARRWLSQEQRTTLESTERNIETLGDRLRQLHREQGGLQLR
jgi:hypothetical protein